MASAEGRATMQAVRIIERQREELEEQVGWGSSRPGRALPWVRLPGSGWQRCVAGSSWALQRCGALLWPPGWRPPADLHAPPAAGRSFAC
jgi:hypothetical protein